MGSNWPKELQDVLANEPCVLITVIGVKGSAPRSAGSKMIVTKNAIRGSIGGGNLEYQAMSEARELLASENTPLLHEKLYGLGPALNQCCGGAVTLLFETIKNSHTPWLTSLAIMHPVDKDRLLITSLDHSAGKKWVVDSADAIPAEIAAHVSANTLQAFSKSQSVKIILKGDQQRYMLEKLENPTLPLYLFGAGHVAKAVVEELSSQPFLISWIDSRSDQFPPSIPDNAKAVLCDDPVTECRKAPANTAFLVMTHSHELDEELCFNILSRNSTTWLGLIGSETKRKRFEHRLGKRGLNRESIEKMVCPVGISGITGKRPATIAVSIAAQLLQDVVPAHWR